MTLGIMILCIMTLDIMKFGIMTLGKMTLGIMTLDQMKLGITLKMKLLAYMIARKKDTQHKYLVSLS